MTLLIGLGEAENNIILWLSSRKVLRHTLNRVGGWAEINWITNFVQLQLYLSEGKSEMETLFATFSQIRVHRYVIDEQSRSLFSFCDLCDPEMWSVTFN